VPGARAVSRAGCFLEQRPQSRHPRVARVAPHDFPDLLVGGESPSDRVGQGLLELAERLHVKPGDEVFAIETEQGILITPYDPTFERAMAAYQRTAGKYRNALRELSK
jgi:antitoxin MazE